MVSITFGAMPMRLCRTGLHGAKGWPPGLEDVGMDFEDVFPGFVIAGLALIAALALGLKAVVDAGRVRAQLAGLTEKFWMLDHRLVRLAERIDQLGAPPGAAAPPTAEPAAPMAPEPAVLPGEAVGVPGEAVG